MTDQLIPFPNKQSRSQMGPWINESLGVPDLAGARRGRGPELRSINNERPLRAQLLDWQEAAELSDAWTDLMTRSMERNVFLEPGFALTAAQHFPPARRPSFLVVSDADKANAPERLIGVCALDVPDGFKSLTHGWLPKQAALGTPLLDKTQGVEAIDLMLAWIEREQPQTAGLLLPSIADNGPTAALLRERAEARSLELRSIDMGERAILYGGVDVEQMLHKAMSAKHVKELRRQRRRLEDMGELTYSSAASPAEIRLAVEAFLTLEAGGWKGGRGTALLSDPATASFVRTMTRRLAREGKCRVDSLDLNGVPIAMGIVLSTGANAFLWKIAYDESKANHSPGVQFTLEFTRRQAPNSGVEATDSCAIPDHPMIDRLWPDKLPMADIAFSIAQGRVKSFDRVYRRELLRRRLRLLAKRAYYAATGRKAS